ncbi:ATP-binding protein, partial [Phenylobacterium sp.]|uniref:ATP-binding protein n=1 Tax=Phenylobacterium sp. TaxID=1871053 RepID=UPI002F3EF672
MTVLLDIAPLIAPASPFTTGAEIYQRFELEADTLAIAVVDGDGRPVGLVERNAFLVRMAAQYGRALWSGRPISMWMNAHPVVVDGDVTVAEFCGRILEESPSALLHGFIVTCGGRYAGVGAMVTLLQAAAGVAQAASRQAREALEARSRFLAVMSHEIRTPLNGVLAVAEIARRKSRQPELSPLLDTIIESGGVLLRLLNDALDVSRAEAAGLELREEPLHPPWLVEEVRRLWTPKAAVKGLDLRIGYDGPPDLWVLADADRLRQILNNLVSNALKFTAEGRVDLTVELVGEGQFAQLRATVQDDGPGVPPDQLEHIFVPFQQTEEGVRQGGAGLGLAVCRQLVERMGGVIRARNAPGRGAVFEMEIPLYSVPTPLPAEAEPAPDGNDGVEGGAHVLVADDNPTNRLIARSICEMFGCTVECVEDGDEAVEAALSGRFDLILMDIKMPRMDGIEATRRIRASVGAVSRIPILALTANADPSDAAFYRR